MAFRVKNCSAEEIGLIKFSIPKPDDVKAFFNLLKSPRILAAH